MNGQQYTINLIAILSTNHNPETSIDRSKSTILSSKFSSKALTPLFYNFLTLFIEHLERLNRLKELKKP